MNEIIEEAVGTLEVGQLHMLVWAESFFSLNSLQKGIPNADKWSEIKLLSNLIFFVKLRSLNETKDEQLCKEKFETLSRNIRKSQTRKQRQMKAIQINTPSNEKREKNEIKGDSEKRRRENNGLDLDAHRSVQGAFVRIQFHSQKCVALAADMIESLCNGIVPKLLRELIFLRKNIFLEADKVFLLMIQFSHVVRKIKTKSQSKFQRKKKTLNGFES